LLEPEREKAQLSLGFSGDFTSLLELAGAPKSITWRARKYCFTNLLKSRYIVFWCDRGFESLFGIPKLREKISKLHSLINPAN
jgi:hypothetical protein